MTDLKLPESHVAPFPTDWQRIAWELRLSVEQAKGHLIISENAAALDDLEVAIKKFSMLTDPICYITRDIQ